MDKYELLKNHYENRIKELKAENLKLTEHNEVLRDTIVRLEKHMKILMNNL